jgi:signal transduction histidine kinase
MAAQSEAQIRNTQVYSRMGLTLAAITGLLAFLLYLRRSHELQASNVRTNRALQHERARLEDLVRERTGNLRELATHLQQVREVDRAKLARELHDELGALLTSAKLCLARMKPKLPPESSEQVQPLLASLAETLNQVIALKRRIIEDLRPSSLDNFGLLTALDILTREFQERSGVAVETNIEPVELTPDAQLSLYRLVQESLTNVAKYAQAKQVFVGLRVYLAHVELTVKDDGVGFDQSITKPKSHGLAGMRHRVESLGGRLDIRSQPGQGTTVFAAFPTGPAAAAPLLADAGESGPPPAGTAPAQSAANDAEAGPASDMR